MREDHVPPEHRDLFGIRTDTPYTESERRYSASVQTRLDELLQGKRRELVLLRRYHAEPVRISALPPPAGVAREDLRLPMIEGILISAISFVRDISPGGPIFQRELRGRLCELQCFSTKYPHIIIEREDLFDAVTRAPVSTEWRLRRTQNQKAETLVNRWLDVANLALSVADRIRPRKG